MENRCRLLPRISFLLFAFLPACTPHHPSSDMISQYLSAKDAYAAGDLEETEQRLGAILAKDRGFHQARFLLGKVYYFQDRPPMRGACSPPSSAAIAGITRRRSGLCAC